MYEIKPLTDTHRAFVDEKILDSWAGPFIVTYGNIMHDTRLQAGFVACDKDNSVLGYALYHIEDASCEITVLESLHERQGIGGALISAVIEAAKIKDCTRVWLVTTNDNTAAIRFYQRFGLSLCAVHIDVIEKARKLKPQIPLLGFDEIPIKHEIEFEKILQGA
jgi:ribosomal protein S18 acetylase RimI-like enzyme